MPATAVQEYRARLNARCAARDALTAVDARLAHARMATFFAGVVLALLAWHAAVAVWWLLAPVAVFVWLVRRHDGVLRARELLTHLERARFEGSRLVQLHSRLTASTP